MSTQDRVKETVAELGDKAASFQERATHKMEQARDAMSEGLKVAGTKAAAAREVVTEGLTALDKRTRSFVEEYPFVSLGIAIGAGFFVGRLVSRR